MGRVLPGQRRQLRPQDRKIERPVGEQQGAGGLGGGARMPEQEPGRQAEADERLRPFEDHDPAQEPLPGPRPFDQQALVLAAEGTTRAAVGPHRRDPLERIEVEAIQGAGMGPHAEVEPLEHGEQRDRQADGEDRRGDRQSPRRPGRSRRSRPR